MIVISLCVTYPEPSYGANIIFIFNFLSITPYSTVRCGSNNEIVILW